MAVTTAKKSLESTFIGFFYLVLTALQSIFLVPVYLNFWGTEKYGYWISIWTFATMMRTLDLGHQNYFGVEFAKLYFSDKEKASSLLGSAFRVAILMGFFEILIYLLILFLGLAPVILGMESSDPSIEYGVLILMLPWALLGGAQGIVIRVLPALGSYGSFLKTSIILKICEIGLLFFAAIFNITLIQTCLLMSLLLIGYIYLIFRYLRKRISEFYPWWKTGSLKAGLNNFFKSISLTINFAAEQLLNVGIVSIIGNFLTITIVPLFSALRTITNLATQVSNLILDPLYPDIIRLEISNEKHKLSQIFTFNWFIVGILINIPFFLVNPFISDLFQLWTSRMYKFDVLVFSGLVVSVMFVSYAKPFMTYIRSLNLIKLLNVITITKLAILFSLALIFIQSLGLNAIMIGVFTSELIGGLFLPILLTKNRLHTILIKEIAIGFVPVLFLIFFYLASYFLKMNGFLISTFFIIIQVFYSLFQWRKLPIDLKKQITNLIPFKI